MLNRALHVVVYLLLLSVVMSCLRSVWIGLTDVPRYQAAFPGAQGPLLWITLLGSFTAAAVAVFISLRRKWAIMANPLVGAVSIVLLEVARGPRLNQVIVLVATTLTTILPWYLWFRTRPTTPG